MASSRSTAAATARATSRTDQQRTAGAQLGDDAIALMDHLRIDNADLVGYSMGAALALSLLTRCPERFRRVILAGIGDSALAADWGIPRLMPRGMPRRFARDVSAISAARAAERTPIDAGMLSSVTCPVLILTGIGDRIAGTHRSLAAAIPGATVVRVPGNHFSVVGHPAFRQAMVDFLSS
jgi:pimeloyl-ACP methyl ester carboxylesterase